MDETGAKITWHVGLVGKSLLQGSISSWWPSCCIALMMGARRLPVFCTAVVRLATALDFADVDVAKCVSKKLLIVDEISVCPSAADFSHLISFFLTLGGGLPSPEAKLQWFSPERMTTGLPEVTAVLAPDGITWWKKAV